MADHERDRGSELVMSPARGLFWRAAFAFVALPGTIAFIVPWLLRPKPVSTHAAGVPILVVGIIMLLWCVRDFYVAGRGTLAPWTPPECLVVIGLYRLSRNPMYVAVLLILVGWATLFATRTMWIYAIVVAIAFHLRVILGEEPRLASVHGTAWSEYHDRVPRWLGVARLHARRKDRDQTSEP
jgi:protein-S-isoprenylcysteine O-methyltransferase Ste14